MTKLLVYHNVGPDLNAIDYCVMFCKSEANIMGEESKAPHQLETKRIFPLETRCEVVGKTMIFEVSFLNKRELKKLIPCFYWNLQGGYFKARNK